MRSFRTRVTAWVLAAAPVIVAFALAAPKKL
jgi:hypothetical protein